MPRCKALEIQRKKAYADYTSLTLDDGNDADGRFSSARDKKGRVLYPAFCLSTLFI